MWDNNCGVIIICHLTQTCYLPRILIHFKTCLIIPHQHSIRHFGILVPRLFPRFLTIYICRRQASLVGDPFSAIRLLLQIILLYPMLRTMPIVKPLQKQHMIPGNTLRYFLRCFLPCFGVFLYITLWYKSIFS